MRLEKLPRALENLYDRDSFIYQDDKTLYYNTKVNTDLIKDILNKEFQVYNGTYRHNYETKETVIFLVGRGKTCGKTYLKIQNFYPYSYIYNKDGDMKTYMGGTVDKITFFTEPKKVADLRKMEESKFLWPAPKDRLYPVPCESDILLVRRFLIDMYDFFKPTEYIEPTVAIFDIETNFPINNNMISFSINNYNTGHVYHNSTYLDNKYSLYLDAYVRLKEFDIVTNWNVEFDISGLQTQLLKFKLLLKPLEDGYIISKEDFIRKVSIEYNLFGIKTTTDMLEALEQYNIIKIEDGIVKYGNVKLDTNLSYIIAQLDLMPITQKMYGKQIRGRWTLDNTGIQICGIGKYDLEGKYPSELDEETLCEYNSMDVIIPEVIDNHLGGILAHVILGWQLQSKLEDMIITAAVNDIALLRAYHKDGIVLPSRPPYDKSNKKANGYSYSAAEPDARPGVYKNVVATDLHAAYPSAVIAINASAETKDSNGKYIAPNGIRFNDGYSTFIEELKRLLENREEVKSKLRELEKGTPQWQMYKSIDFAIKTLIAAFSHGIFGWENSRMVDFEIADAITSTVRGVVDTIKNKVDELGFKWCYAHTDSCYFIAQKDKSNEIVSILNDTIKEYCDKRGYSTSPNLEYKGFYKYAYIHSPARNVLIPEDGSIYEPSTWNVTGMPFIRSDTPQPVGDIETSLISMKLDSKTNEEMLQKLIQMIDELKEMDSRELALIKPLTKSMSRYGRKGKDGMKCGVPYHIKALKLAEDDYGYKIKVGEKFSLLPIIVDKWTGIRVKRRITCYIAFDSEKGLPEMYKLDWDTYLRSNLFGKIHSLFDCTSRELEKLINNDI